MTIIHELKTGQDAFRAVAAGIRTFEVLEGGETLEIGDLVCLREWADICYTGRALYF